MKPRFYILGNGINVNPGDSRDWNRRGAIWIEQHTDYDAQPYLYFQDALLRRLFQDKRVEEVAEVVRSFRCFNHDVCLVGHSNFCDVICRYLQRHVERILSIHLIAAACESDFNKNGINAAMDLGLSSAVIFCSKVDHALIAAKDTGRFLKWFGLGYGSLGLTGPINVKYPDRVKVIWRNTFDHSTWFDGCNFDDTMRSITE